MTYDEVKNRLEKAASDPDTVQAEITGVINDIRADYDTIDALTAEIAAKDDKIRNLQDTNTRLFLQIAGDTPDEPEPEPLTGEAAVDDFFSKYEEV